MTVTVLSPARDGRIVSTSGTFNYGIANLCLSSNVTKGLLFFDASAIPAAAQISSAVLALYQANTGAALAWTVTAYSVMAANGGWIEGTKNGAQALSGEPCWNAKVADGGGGVTTAWAGGAGLPTAGVDYVAAAIGSASGNRSDANGTLYSFALTPAVVKTWCGAVNANYGILLIPSASTGGLASKEHATAGWRPTLTITWTLPGGVFNPPIAAPLRGVF